MKVLFYFTVVINLIMLFGCYLKLDEPDTTPVRLWISIWETRNAFGRICSLIMIIITIPAEIAFYIISISYGLILIIQYLGIKK